MPSRATQPGGYEQIRAPTAPPDRGHATKKTKARSKLRSYFQNMPLLMTKVEKIASAENRRRQTILDPINLQMSCSVHKVPDLLAIRIRTQQGQDIAVVHKMIDEKNLVSLDKCLGRTGAMGQMANFVEAAFQNPNREEMIGNLSR